MNRRNVIRLAASTAAMTLMSDFSLTAFAQQKLVLKSADVHPLGYPTVEAVKMMGEKLAKATDGRLTVQLFPAM